MKPVHTSNVNAASNNKGDLSVPKFQNKNLNYPRGLPPSGRTGQPKPGVQVIQAKQKVGKAVGAAALPPTPLNTPSLKRETETNQSSLRAGQTSNNEDLSPSLKGLSAPVKPAPWAKSGALAEVEKAEEPKAEPVSTSKQNARSWANADDSDDDERQENLPETEWPDNFRETAEELPSTNEQPKSEDGFGHQRYVPPARNKPTANTSIVTETRQHPRMNDPESFYDKRFTNQGNGPMGNRFQQSSGTYRGGNDRQPRDRDFSGHSHRQDGEPRQFRQNQHRSLEEGEEDRNHPESRNRFRGRFEDEHSDQQDHRVSSRFSQDSHQPDRPYGRYDRGNDTNEPNHSYGHGHSNTSFFRASQSQSYHDNRAIDRYGSRNYDSHVDQRYGHQNDRYGRDHRETSGNDRYHYSNNNNNYQGKRTNYYHPAGSDDGDANSRQRSHSLSEDNQYNKPHFQRGKGLPEASEPAYPDESMDLKGIESSRLEAEFLESRKTRPPERQDFNQMQRSHDSEISDSRRPPAAAFNESNHHRYENPASNHNVNFHSRQVDEAPAWTRNRQQTLSNFPPNSQTNTRPTGPFSSSLMSGRPKYEISEREVGMSEYHAPRRDLSSSQGHEAGPAGSYHGPDAVKLSFPQHPQDDRPPLSYPSQYDSTEQHQLHNYRKPMSAAPVSSSVWRDDQGHHHPSYPVNHLPYDTRTVDIAAPSSRNDEEHGHGRNRPKQLFDPKSDQLIDAAGLELHKTKHKPPSSQPVHGSSLSKDGGANESEKWPKILQHGKKEPDQEASVTEKVPAVQYSPRNQSNEKTKAAEERKAARQKERLSREPRTKGFLYRFNEKGELERVMSTWEKEQEVLAQKKNDLSEYDMKNTASYTKKVSKVNSKESERSHSAASGSSHPHPSSREGHFDLRGENASKAESDSNAAAGSRGSSAIDAMAPALDAGSPNILGSLMQGPSLYDSWNRPSPPGIEDSRTDNDISGQGQMNWLTGATSTATNPSFSSGLSSLGSSGLAGIISTATVPSTLFPNNQQDWSYNSILHNDDSNHTSLNPVFSSNSLSEINRPSNSFSPFSGINITTNLQEGSIIDKTNASLNRPEEGATVSSAPDNSKFIQREWQRFAQSNAFGAVGNKTSSKATASQPPAKETTTSSAEEGKEKMDQPETKESSSAALIIEEPRKEAPTRGRGGRGGRRFEDRSFGGRGGRSSHQPYRPPHSSNGAITTSFHTKISSKTPEAGDAKSKHEQTEEKSASSPPPPAANLSSDDHNPSSSHRERGPLSSSRRGNNYSNPSSAPYSSSTTTSRSNSNYSNHTRASPGSFTSNRNGGRGFSGPRAQSEVKAEGAKHHKTNSKANEAGTEK